MAWIRDFSYNSSYAATTTATSAMPIHQADDLILFVCGSDTSSGGTFTTPTEGGSWNVVQTQDANNLSTASFWRVATSSSDTAPTSTKGTSDEMISMIMIIADVNTSTPINTSASVSIGAATHTGPAATTTTDDTINVFWHFQDNPGRYPSQPPGLMTLDIPTPISAVVASTSWTFQQALGAAITPSWELQSSDEGHIHTICINSAVSSPILAPCADYGSPPSTILNPLRSTGTANVWGGGAVDPAADLTGGLGPNSVGFTYLAPSQQQAGGVYGIDQSLLLDTPSSTSDNKVSGAIWNFSLADENLAGKLICYHMGLASPQFKSANSLVADGGTIMGLRSDDLNVGTSNAYRVWSTAAVDSKPSVNSQHATVIDVDDTALQWGADVGSETTPAFDSSTVTGLFIGGLRGKANDMRNTIAECHIVNTCTIISGGSARPASLTTFVDGMFASRILTISNQQLGSTKQVFSMQPLQIGNGTDSVYFEQDSASLEFATTTDVTTKIIRYNCGANVAGITFYAVSGDTITFTNSAISSGTVWDFAIHASATSAATWNFSGLNIINADVVLRDVFTAASGMTFIDCPTFTGNSADLSGGCTFDNTLRTVTSEAELTDTDYGQSIRNLDRENANG